MDVEIRTGNRDLVSSLFQRAEPEVGDQVTLAQGINVTLCSIRRTSGMMESGMDIVSLAVGTVSGVAAGIVANWIWHYIKDKPVKAMTIEKTTVEVISRSEILRILQEKLEIPPDEHNERKR